VVTLAWGLGEFLGDSFGLPLWQSLSSSTFGRGVLTFFCGPTGIQMKVSWDQNFYLNNHQSSEFREVYKLINQDKVGGQEACCR
jgi:hypothetical protein